MGKINLLVKYCLANQKYEYNIKGIIENNIIKYKDKEFLTLVYLKKNIIKRIKDKDILILDFNNKKCIIEQINYYINIDVLKIININNKFYVKYKIYNDLFEIELIY